MERSTVSQVGALYLQPGNTRIFRGRLGSIHCVLNGTEAFANVYCLLCFPISNPDHYIAVCHTDDDNKEQEIGIIESLDAFPAEVQELVRASLKRQYFAQVVTRVLSVKFEFGLLFFEVMVEGDRKIEFAMRWQHDKAIDYGNGGKVLLDVFDNRFIIPSVSDLSKADQDRLKRFIYW